MRILWIKTEFLHPVDKGGRIRTYQMLRAIRRDHEVTYLTLDDGTATPEIVQKAHEYADTVVTVPFAPTAKGTFEFYIDLLRNVASRLPYAAARYRSPELSEQIRAMAWRNDIVVCDFLAPSLNVPLGLGRPTVLFQHNVETMIWKRHAAMPGNPIRRLYMREQWRRMLSHERAECARFDQIVAVSPVDAAFFREEFGSRKVADVPTGVDTEFFRPSGKLVTRRHELVFTGSMDWIPNQDAMVWFIRDVLPLIRSSVPDVSLTVVGRDPPTALRLFAENTSSIIITGSVPDVRKYVEQAAVFVVPIRIGGGTRLKIFEAMAMGCPVVSTTIGAEGLPVVDGVDIILADEARAFADAVVSLLLNPARRLSIARAGARKVATEHGWDRVAAQFVEVCARLLERAEPSHPL